MYSWCETGCTERLDDALKIATSQELEKCLFKPEYTAIVNRFHYVCINRKDGVAPMPQQMIDFPKRVVDETPDDSIYVVGLAIRSPQAADVHRVYFVGFSHKNHDSIRMAKIGRAGDARYAIGKRKQLLNIDCYLITIKRLISSFPDLCKNITYVVDSSEVAVVEPVVIDATSSVDADDTVVLAGSGPPNYVHVINSTIPPTDVQISWSRTLTMLKACVMFMIKEWQFPGGCSVIVLSEILGYMNKSPNEFQTAMYLIAISCCAKENMRRFFRRMYSRLCCELLDTIYDSDARSACFRMNNLPLCEDAEGSSARFETAVGLRVDQVMEFLVEKLQVSEDGVMQAVNGEVTFPDHVFAVILNTARTVNSMLSIIEADTSGCEEAFGYLSI